MKKRGNCNNEQISSISPYSYRQRISGSIKIDKNSKDICYDKTGKGIVDS